MTNAAGPSSGHYSAALAEKAARAALLSDEEEAKPEQKPDQDMGSLTGWQALADQADSSASHFFWSAALPTYLFLTGCGLCHSHKGISVQQQ